jgi:RHS repeat-associated protein
VSDGATSLAIYKYAGSGYRVLEKQLPQALTTLYRAYDDDRRVKRHDQRTASTRLAGYSYAWDRVGNRWFERTLTNNANPNETAGSGEAFAYDSAYRMVDYYEGVPSTSLDGLQSNVPRHSAAVTGYTALRRYNLDGVGNRIDHIKNGVVEDVYALAGDDAKTNQYTLVDDAFQSYDPAGNLLEDAGFPRIFQYDWQNRLIRVSDTLSDKRYRSDVLGRRVSKRRTSGNFDGLTYGHAVYIHFGAEILEETDTAGLRRKEWVYGIAIDEPIRQRAPDTADLDNDANTTELVDLYYLTNSLGTVTGLVRTTGAVAERYQADVWGVILNVIDKNGASTGSWKTLVGNPWQFTGRQLDFEDFTQPFQLYHFRARAYRPAVGQFAQRDPIGVWGDRVSLGAARGYVGFNPANRSDPWGLDSVDESRLLPDVGGTALALALRYENCDAEQRQKTGEALDLAIPALWEAGLRLFEYSELEADDPDSATGRFMYVYFGGDTSRSTAFAFARNIAEIRRYLSIERVTFTCCPCSEEIKIQIGHGNAYVKQYPLGFFGKTIHLCDPEFFNDGPARRAETLAHELSHMILKTGHGGDPLRDAFKYGQLVVAHTPDEPVGGASGE